MKDDKFKSLSDKTPPSLDEKVFETVFSELDHLARKREDRKDRRRLFSWLAGGLLTAGYVGFVSRRVFTESGSAGFDPAHLDPEVELADFDKDYELFESDEFDELINPTEEG